MSDKHSSAWHAHKHLACKGAAGCYYCIPIPGFTVIVHPGEPMNRFERRKAARLYGRTKRNHRRLV